MGLLYTGSMLSRGMSLTRLTCVGLVNASRRACCQVPSTRMMVYTRSPLAFSPCKTPAARSAEGLLSCRRESINSCAVRASFEGKSTKVASGSRSSSAVSASSSSCKPATSTRDCGGGKATVMRPPVFDKRPNSFGCSHTMVRCLKLCRTPGGVAGAHMHCGCSSQQHGQRRGALPALLAAASRSLLIFFRMRRTLSRVRRESRSSSGTPASSSARLAARRALRSTSNRFCFSCGSSLGGRLGSSGPLT